MTKEVVPDEILDIPRCDGCNVSLWNFTKFWPWDFRHLGKLCPTCKDKAANMLDADFLKYIKASK